MDVCVLVVILLLVVRLITFALGILVIGLGVAYNSPLWIIIGFGVVFFANVIALTILSNNLNGFMVVGLWPKIILAVCFSLFKLRAPEED